MEKEGNFMSEEKKKLTDEERKSLKEKMKKQIDEMSDEELNNVAGGWSDKGGNNNHSKDSGIETQNETLGGHCNICGKKFEYFEDMIKHKKEVHNM